MKRKAAEAFGRAALAAEMHAGEDSQKRELVEMRNQAEQMVYSTRKSLEEHGDKVSPEVRSGIESAIGNLEDKIKGDDKPAMEAALKQLSDASLELGKAVYEATSEQAAAGSQDPTTDEAASSGGDDDVIDAEFEVKDEK